MNNFLEIVLIAVWIIGSYIQPSLSFSAGVTIYYIFQIDRGVKTLSLWYFVTLLVVSTIGGYYVSQATPLLLPSEYAQATGTVNFFLGLFAKVILDVVLTADFIRKILGGKK